MAVNTIELAYLTVSSAKGIRQVLERVVGSVARNLARTVTLRLREAPAGSKFGTPVDTGWASSNWVPTVGKEPSAPVGSKQAVNTGPSDAGIQVLKGYRWSPNDVLYVTNLVPYITDLDKGTSRQQRAGFVQRAIMQAIMNDMPVALVTEFRS
jgi:hypothetical protein